MEGDGGGLAGGQLGFIRPGDGGGLRKGIEGFSASFVAFPLLFTTMTLPAARRARDLGSELAIQEKMVFVFQ